MDKFILLTNTAGTKSLANLHYITAIVEHEGKTYVAILNGTPAAVLETVDEIAARIQINKGNVV